MATPDYRAFSLTEYPIDDLEKLSLAIVRTEWNNDIVDRLTSSCIDTLVTSGLHNAQLSTYKVPGSFELPMGAKLLLGSKNKPDAIICLGCVIQGETKHDDYINHTIARAIAQLGIMSNVPVIFGVLTVNNIDQAHQRAGGNHGDKGAESAIAALKMISLKQQLLDSKKTIGFS